LTIKLTRHVAPALAFSRKFFCADNSPFHNSLSRTNLRTKIASQSSPTEVGEALRVFASFFSCQRASALGNPQSVPRPAERPKILRTEIKNPASSAGPIRLPNKRKRLRAMLDWILSCIRNRPHFEPKRAR